MMPGSMVLNAGDHIMRLSLEWVAKLHIRRNCIIR